MSHELRTPLNAILGYSELLLEEAAAEESQQRTDVERIRGAAEHLLGLINSILDLSKIEAAKMELATRTGIAWARYRAPSRIVSSRPQVATPSLTHCAPPLRAWVPGCSSA